MENIYYIYCYLNPLKPGKFKYKELEFDYEPFYIGKGEGTRCYVHLGEKKLSNKTEVIKNLYKSGCSPIIIKLYENLEEQKSLILEKDVIKKIGRQITNEGPLTNITSGGQGGSGKKPKEWIDILSKPVIQYDLNMNKIKEFSSIKEASNEIGIVGIQISKVCRNIPKHNTAGGFKWTFKNEEDNGLQKHIKKGFIIKKSPHSEETKTRMRKPKTYKEGHHPLKGKNLSTTKKVIQYTLDGVKIKEWNSISDIRKELKYNYGWLLNRIETNKPYKGYYWRYLV